MVIGNVIIKHLNFDDSNFLSMCNENEQKFQRIRFQNCPYLVIFKIIDHRNEG